MSIPLLFLNNLFIQMFAKHWSAFTETAPILQKDESCQQTCSHHHWFNTSDTVEENEDQIELNRYRKGISHKRVMFKALYPNSLKFLISSTLNP